MTSLDVRAAAVRERAAAVKPPSLATVLVTLIGLLPWLLGWVFNAVWQVLRILWAAFLKGWETNEAHMGTGSGPESTGGS